MAVVSGGRSTLNPNAPLFVPAAIRQVEDFSPEWWELMTTSCWFHGYWLSQQQEEGGFFGHEENAFNGNDIADLLPDTIDIDDDISTMEAQFEQFIHESENIVGNKMALSALKGLHGNGAEALMESLNHSKSPRERGQIKSSMDVAKRNEKPAKPVSPRSRPQLRIHQPR